MDSIWSLKQEATIARKQNHISEHAFTLKFFPMSPKNQYVIFNKETLH